MSYCRWSSDNFRCDLYVYRDVTGGYTVMVANNRYPADIPLITAPCPSPEWIAQRRLQNEYLDTHGMTPLGLSKDGQILNVSTLDELHTLLLGLREEGYRIPQSALDTIKKESMEYNDEPDDSESSYLYEQDEEDDYEDDDYFEEDDDDDEDDEQESLADQLRRIYGE
jgi:hypothetical protein